MSTLSRLLRDLALFFVALLLGGGNGVSFQNHEAAKAEKGDDPTSVDPCGGEGSHAKAIDALKAHSRGSSEDGADWGGVRLLTFMVIAGILAALLGISWWVQRELHEPSVAEPLPPPCWKATKDLAPMHQLKQNDVSEVEKDESCDSGFRGERLLGQYLLEAVKKGEYVAPAQLAALAAQPGYEVLVFEPQGVPRVLLESLRAGHLVRLCASAEAQGEENPRPEPGRCTPTPVEIVAVSLPEAEDDFPWVAVEIPSPQVQAMVPVVTATTKSLLLVGATDAESGGTSDLRLVNGEEQ